MPGGKRGLSKSPSRILIHNISSILTAVLNGTFGWAHQMKIQFLQSRWFFHQRLFFSSRRQRLLVRKKRVDAILGRTLKILY